MSAPYLSQLRSGNRTNPSVATMAALANFFRIKPAYFTDDEYYEKLDKELAWLANMRDEGVRRDRRAHRRAVPRGPAGPGAQGGGIAPQGAASTTDRGSSLSHQVAVLPRDLDDPVAVGVAVRLT